MKNKGLFFASLVGGALVGSALTCFFKSTKGVELRGQAHEKIIQELKHLRAHISGHCHCDEGECQCNMNMPSTEGGEQSNG